ncbi:hypothetical protein GPECTOR_22g918 [Gonium pectorale]|uniref:Uncharacterized protein n=1 Tax=Gonium pectorale TaxID=33097 RepID=A0A150GHM6_GONPE|nr:hypothetical protein GPECTOR_22g918 [Gonium pectorale]|eukprot:KXZ49324.1 hypothetical protein GPECTOR_22g918 [Gonium pectorale]
MDYGALLELLNNLNQATSVDSDEVLLYLQQYKEGFLKLLDFKALLLSDELRLDEVLCVEYLTSALEERGVFGAEYAGGLYLEERQVALRCLARLLAEDARTQHAQHNAGGPAGQQRTPHSQAIASFVSELLGEKDAGGRQLLVGRLVAILRDTSLEPRPDSGLPLVRDEAGNPISRALLLQRERRHAGRCLLYAVARDPHLAPSLAGELLELLSGLISRMGGTGSGDLFLLEECHLVLLSACCVLSPHEGRNFQQAAMQELAQSTRSKIESIGQAGYGPALRLCWGLLAVASQAAPQDGSNWVRESLRAGALTFLRQVFHHPHFKLDEPTHHHVVAAAVHHLVTMLLRTDAERAGGSFFSQLLLRNESAIRPTGHPGTAYALSYVPYPPEAPEARADHIGSVLGLLADAFDAFPCLYLANLADQEAGQRPVKEFLDRAINHPIMRSSPEVRVPFLQLMAALAGSERGAHLVLRQMEAMAAMPALEVLTLRKLFHTVLHYCLRFFATLSEVQRQQQAQMQGGMGAVGAALQGGAPAQVEAIMNPYEAEILVAFLHLLKRVLEYGRHAEVSAFWTAASAELAPSLNGFPLHEPLFQLMCYPVQNTVKAALDEVLGALAAAVPELAPRLLERLLQCTVVRPASAMLPTVPRLDIVQQLNEVEARREEYPETLALIELMNALLGPLLGPARGGVPGGMAAAAAAGSGVAGGVAPGGLPDGGADLVSFTTFVQQHVLGHLWSRGYREARQKWEVAAAAFTHLEHVLELATRGPLPPPLPANEAMAAPKHPPGYLIMHDLLGGGPAYAALLHILSPGYSSLTALQSQTDEVGPREAAVLAGLRLINSALRLDEPFVEALGRVHLNNRYQPLHLKLMSGGIRQIAVLLQYVCYPDSAEIQVEAIRLALVVSARLPNIVELLAQAGGAANGGAAAAGVPYVPASVAAGLAGAAATAAAAAANGDLADVLGSLRRGFAQAMSAGAACPNALDNLDAPPTERLGPYGAAPSSDPPDPRAALVLRLLLQASGGRAGSEPPVVPSLAHLLLGYDMECGLGGRVDESLLLPSQEYSCLTIIERILTQHQMRMALTKPKLYSQSLGLLQRLASAPVGGLPMLEYLSPKNNPLIPSLRGLLTLELPAGGAPEAAEARPHELAAALHSRSHYMRITALLLLRLEHEDSSRALLAELLAAPGAPAAGGAAGDGPFAASSSAAPSAGSSTLLDTLRSVAGLAFSEPQPGDLNGEQRRMLQDLSAGDVPLEQLLASSSLMRAAGVAMESDTGDLLFSFEALTALLRARLDAYAARAGGALGGAADAASDAARAALRYAQRANAAALLGGAQGAAVEAWQQLVQVVFTRQYELLNGLVRGTAAEALYETLLACLETVRGLLSRPDGAVERAAAPLCSASRVLLAKLQEQSILHVSLGQPSDPLASIRVPSRCQSLLRTLLGLIHGAATRRTPAVRLQLYAAVLQYLQLSRGSKLATECAPAVLAALLRGCCGGAVGSGAEAVAALDQAVALHLMRALLVADSSGGNGGAVAAACCSANVPQQLLSQVAALSGSALSGGGKRGRRVVHMAEAALALLAALAAAGPATARAQSAQRLYGLNCLTALTRCAALDLVPDDPTTAPLRGPGAVSSSDNLRYRLAAVAAPLLRLLLTLLAALPDHADARADAAAFAAAHHGLLTRLLSDAAGAGTRSWAPGDTELELADLALGLLVRLVPCLPSMQPLQSEGLLAGAYKLVLQFCCLEERSASPIIQGLRASRRDAAGGAVAAGALVLATPGQQPAARQPAAGAAGAAGFRSAACSRGARVLSVRCSLARLMRDMATAAVAVAPSAAGGSPRPAGLLRALGPPERREMDPSTGRPTLQLVRDMAQQACHDASAALDELCSLLALLRTPDAALDEGALSDCLAAYAPAGSASVAAALAAGASAAGAGARRRLARHYCALAATTLDRQLCRALFVLEAGLSTIAIHFLRCLPRPHSGVSAAAGGGGAVGMDTDELLDAASATLELAAGMPSPSDADAAALGTPDEVSHFLSLLADTCRHAEELLARLGEAEAETAAAGGGGGAGLGASLTAGAGLGLGCGDASGAWARQDMPGGGGAGQQQQQPVEGIDLMVRALKMYCARC